MQFESAIQLQPLVYEVNFKRKVNGRIIRLNNRATVLIRATCEESSLLKEIVTLSIAENCVPSIDNISYLSQGYVEAGVPDQIFVFETELASQQEKDNCVVLNFVTSVFTYPNVPAAPLGATLQFTGSLNLAIGTATGSFSVRPFSQGAFSVQICCEEKDGKCQMTDRVL